MRPNRRRERAAARAWEERWEQANADPSTSLGDRPPNVAVQDPPPCHPPPIEAVGSGPDRSAGGARLPQGGGPRAEPESPGRRGGALRIA